MSVVIRNFTCAQMPEMKIIGASTSRTSVKYFVHASRVVGLLTGKNARAALNAFHNFIESRPDMSQGGNLAAAFQKGETDAMMYTYYTHNGVHPSYFFTVEGVKETLRGFPNQLEDVHRRFCQLFQAFDENPASVFEPGSVIEQIQRGQVVELPVKRARVTFSDRGVYVLRFNDDMPGRAVFYVGKSNDIEERIRQHARDEGAVCVKGRSFTRVSAIVAGSVDDIEGWERSEVLERMFQFGINAVRGWKFTLTVMTLEQRLSAFDDVCERFDLCRRCGRGDHFVRECQALTTDRWTNGLDVRTMYRMHMSSDKRNEQFAAADAKFDEERKARLAAEAKAEAEHEARLAMERRNAEAVRLLTAQAGDF